MTDVRLSTFSRRNPVVRDPRRVMPDMLSMSAFKLSNPVQIFILMKANDLSRLTFQLALWFHGVFQDRGSLLSVISTEAPKEADSGAPAAHVLVRHRSACGMVRRNRSVA